MPKDIRFISKRRKNQLIRSRIQFYSIHNSGDVENTCALGNEISKNNLENNITVTSTSLIEDHLTCNFPMDISSNLQDSVKTTDNEIEENVNLSDTNNLNLIEVNNDESQTFDESSASNLRDRLSLWVMEENITQKSVN